MAVNNYFRNYTSPVEQTLIDDLVIESIKIHGVDVYYVARKLINEDKILNDVSVSIFDRAFLTEMYIKNFDGMGGLGDSLNRFEGGVIKDQMTMTVAIRTFNKYIKNNDPTIPRPMEGHILFFPMNKKFFEISFVEHESVFYQGGTLYIYDLKCELLSFTNQKFETGIELIDNYSVEFKTDDVDDMTTLYDRDPISKNLFFEEESEELIDNSEFDPFVDILITSLKKE